MAGFAIEDAFLKTVTKQVPVGQVLMIFGAVGLCIFAIMARRTGAQLFHPQAFTQRMLYRAVFEFFGRLFYILAIALTPMSSATGCRVQSVVGPFWAKAGLSSLDHDGQSWSVV